MKEKLDQLIEKITHGKFSDEILEARKDYQKLAGEIYEDDKSYESRVGLFLEWYMFDRIDPHNQMTPLEALIKDNGNEDLPVELKNVREFLNNVHGLFVVKKIREKEVLVLNLLEDKKYKVRETEGKILFQKNELIEGRIVFVNGDYFFTGNFCFHPKDALKYIKSEVQKITTLRNGYLKDLKKGTGQLKDLNSRLKSNARDIEKIDSKMSKTKSVEKITVWSDQSESLKKVRAEILKQVSAAEFEQSTLENDKLKIEIKRLSNNLIQRLHYMNLKWERSRQIELQDIYRN